MENVSITDVEDELHDVLEAKKRYFKTFRLIPKPSKEELETLNSDLAKCDALEAEIRTRLSAILDQMDKDGYLTLRRAMVEAHSRTHRWHYETSLLAFETTWKDKFDWLWENGVRTAPEMEYLLYRK